MEAGFLQRTIWGSTWSYPVESRVILLSNCTNPVRRSLKRKVEESPNDWWDKTSRYPGRPESIHSTEARSAIWKTNRGHCPGYLNEILNPHARDQGTFGERSCGEGKGSSWISLVSKLTFTQKLKQAWCHLCCGAFFIWVNSVSGLLARLQYNSIDIENYMPLILGALIGGFRVHLWEQATFTPKRWKKHLVLFWLLLFSCWVKKCLSL